MNRQPVGLALLGCGAFGRFCQQQYRTLAEVEFRACADLDREVAEQTAAEFGGEACDSLDALLARDDVDVVHLATPPAVHREQAIRALQAGKHVLCEKPLATRLEDAVAMRDAAREAGRILAVNLIMRYDPLCTAVETILQEKLLGEPIRAFFENYAKDEPLGPEHWFWNPDASGGIFIEHGVHFFDLFAMWLGAGEVLDGTWGRRPGAATPLVEQVHCTARYGGNVLTTFYHGFHQATRMDRQEMRIVCERGDIRLDEWLPTYLRIDALADRATRDRLAAVIPHAHVEEKQQYADGERYVTSRHKAYEVDGRYTITGDTGMDKPALYGFVLRALLADQVRAMRDPAHERRVTEDNGLTSLALAVEATRCAGAGD